MKIFTKVKKAVRIGPAIRLVWSGAPRWTAAQITLIFIQGLLPLLSLYLTKLIIDSVTANLSSPAITLALRPLLILLGLLGAVNLITVWCSNIATFINTNQTQRMTDYMSDIIHAKSIEVDLGFYENPEYQNTLIRAQQEASYRPNQILRNLVMLGQNSVSLLAMLGLLISLHWSIGALLFIAAIPAVLVKIKYAQVFYQWTRKRTELERQAWYMSWLLTDNQFAKEVRLFGLGNLFSDRFTALRKVLYQENYTISAQQVRSGIVAQSLSTILTFSAYAYIVWQAFQGALRIGDLVIYHEALKRGQSALSGLMSQVSTLYQDNLFLSNLYEFLELEPLIKSPKAPHTIPKPMRQGIVFKDIEFGYASSRRQAIKKVNLTVRPGETIALVGENGCGKTTLIKLLCRLYDPSAGEITIDGQDIRSFDITDLRRQISVTFQDYVQYFMTAQENIWLGNIDVDLNDDLISKAAFRSGADAVIQSLPKGYETVLGTQFYEGEELSIGQWQKVALARAFLRESQVLILDEPTSAMDPKAEYEVFSKFRDLIQDQAAILITHRLSTVKMADRIYVMDQGSIIEHGSHQDLMAMEGRYAQLFETQASNYR